MSKIKMWLGWTVGESGSLGFRCTDGDYGQAQGKYQFDYRYTLVPFMQRCVNYSSAHYSEFQPFIALGVNNRELVYNAQLKALWLKLCDKYPAEFEALQDRHAMEDYYIPAANYVLQNYGINMEKHDPAVKVNQKRKY